MATVEELYAQGEKLKDEGRFEEAAAKFQESLQVDESYALAHFALAVVDGKLGRHEDAVRHAERAVELESPRPVFLHRAERDLPAGLRGHTRSALHSQGRGSDGARPRAAAGALNSGVANRVARPGRNRLTGKTNLAKPCYQCSQERPAASNTGDLRVSGSERSRELTRRRHRKIKIDQLNAARPKPAHRKRS